MAFKFKKIPLYIFIAANLLMVVAMNFCAYSSYLPPQMYPNWSFLGMVFPAFLILNLAFVVFWLVFKRRLAMVPVVGIAMCGWAVRTYCPVNFSGERPEGCIKVLTYNVMAFNKGEYPYWAENPIIAYIINSDADIVCLQEATDITKVDSLMTMLGKKYEHIEVQPGGSCLAVLSRYPILSVEKIVYESVSNTSFAYEILKGEDTILVVNNHLESFRLTSADKDDYEHLLKHPKDDDAEEKYDSLTVKLTSANAVRGAQADSVAAYIDRKAAKYVVACGDFNAPSISYTHHRLTRTLNDAYTRSGNGLGVSYNRNLMYFRIDHLLCSPNIKAYGAKVDSYSKASDHYPLFSYLELQ